MKKVLSLGLILILAMSLTLTGCGSKEVATEEAASKPIKIVAAHNQTSPENPYQIGMLKFKEVAESKSNGAFEVEVFAGSLGTSESELVEKLKLGAADVVVVSPGFMSQTGIEEIDLFALPYLFNNYEHWGKVVDGEVGKKMAKLIQEKSNNEFKVIGYWTAGVRHYYGNKPLTSMKDLEGMKIRTQTSGVVAKYWTQMGSIPTSVAWGELYQSLQQNIVDGAENAYPYFVQQNHHKTDNGKYITETGHDYTTRFLLANAKKFDAMTPEQQKTFLEAADAAVKAERDALYAQEEEYKNIAIKDGAEVNEIDRAPFIELAQPLQDEAAKEIGIEDLLKQVRDLK
ncbi:TRAP transporter substrate-binding protein [Marinisporobacter balticus]|uniref:Tripartite ATP-independent transporter DctP family solute receptor n=1 Tax=Marinisporobacter balticus TaxID=2018667 RepID=A0A4R2KU64_9FIRM|nr:TRAP transporter substrate-binding protein [Marinisporobacter balticus]TCO77414.1 tripartite ATP-independent transporter DctP family solute receptor [Marinisporobacter balticus]